MYLEYYDKTPVIHLWLANQVLVQCNDSPASHPTTTLLTITAQYSCVFYSTEECLTNTIIII